MADIVDRATRSRMMSGIRGTDTRPEMMVRKGLHAAGFRFRLHVRDLPGRPDIVLPRHQAAIFVNGCFWHGHDCHLFRLPATRTGFWCDKIAANRQRDVRSLDAIREAGWRSLVIWECAIKGRTRLLPDELLRSAADWIRSTVPVFEISGIQ